MLATRKSERTAVATACSMETGGGCGRTTPASNRTDEEDSAGGSKTAKRWAVLRPQFGSLSSCLEGRVNVGWLSERPFRELHN